MRNILKICILMAATLLLTLGLTLNQALASSQTFTTYESSEDNTLNASLKVTKTIQLPGIVTPNSTYYYDDGFGYKGYIQLDYFIHDHGNNITIAVYAGTVHCQGSNCPIIQSE